MGPKKLFMLGAAGLVLSVVIIRAITVVSRAAQGPGQSASQQHDPSTFQSPEESARPGAAGTPNPQGPDQDASGIRMPGQALDEDSGEVKAALPLFHRVDEQYMRGSEPARGGVDVLVKLGVKSIVDLRSNYDRTSGVASEADRVGLHYYWLPLSVWDPPTDAQTAEFLAVVTDKSLGPIFVFCADGVNRTGEMTAIYRIVHDEWSVERAVKEMDDTGFSPYYYSLRNYVWAYARTRKLNGPHRN